MNILGFIKDYWGDVSIALVILFTVVQFAPIKVNPWSYIARQIGLAINKGLLDELRAQSEQTAQEFEKVNSSLIDLDKKINENEEKRIKADDKAQKIADKREVKRLRAEILQFAADIRYDDHPRFRSEFQHIFEAHDDYEKLLDKLNMTNGYTSAEMEVIKNKYFEQYGEQEDVN